MKQKKLKVWGGGYGERTIVAAYTQKQAIDLTGYSYRSFKDYFCLTGNDNDLAKANRLGAWKVSITKQNGCGHYFVSPQEMQWVEYDEGYYTRALERITEGETL